MQSKQQVSLNSDDPILRLPEVIRQCGLSKSSIYNGINEGTFPRPIKLGGRASGWLLSEINIWKRDRIAASRMGEA